MANSRSNIYPVQLQGAELNLNKFDAEIKQYSGFNKNNSPFVGGCLSNLFTKTEENTTGSSDSVYVDDNGDVYELKLDPNNDNRPTLFKNNKPVIEYKNEGDYSLRGWTSKKLDLPKNTVFYDVAVENYQIVADFRIESLETDSDTVLTRLKYTYRDFLNETTITDYLDVVTPDTSSKDNFAIDKTFYYWKRVNADEVSFGFKMYTRDIVNDVGYVVMKVKPFKTNYSNMLREWTVSFTGGYADDYYNRYTSFYYYVSSGSYILFNNMSSYCRYFPSDTTQDYMDIRDVTLSLNSTYSDIDILNNLQFYDVFFSDKIYVCTANFTSDYYNRKILIAAPYTSISLYVPRPQQPDYYALRVDITINDSNINECLVTQSITIQRDDDQFGMGRRDNAYYLRNWGCCYGIKTRSSKYVWGVCDFLTESITLDNNEPMFKIGALCGGGVLINNGNISGLSLPGGRILVSDWNTVADNIVIGGRSGKDFKYIIYQDTSGDYYMVSCLENKLQLKVINGLLVTNINRTKNCYRLSDGKILTFAPAWNNRAPKNNMQEHSGNLGNDYYLASSINEYNLKDNASIILNPVPVISDKITDLRISNFNSSIEKYCINFYTGSINSNEFLYVCSSDIENDKYYFNVDLKDMPFPLDTNGNVQLSPSLFCESKSFGNDVFIKEGSNAYQLIKDGAESVMSYYLGTLIENLEDIFILQGQYYAIINKQIFNVQFSGGVVQSLSFVVSVENLQFCGNSAYQAYFFSKTNRCIYVFTGANILNQLQLVDKISEIYAYKYNQSTQSIILITDLGTIVSSNLGMYLIEGFTPDDVFFYDKGVVFVSDSELTYLQYYEADGFERHNIEVETCFYGMNNETVTINDCLYIRLFSEEHEEGEVKVSATTISLKGRKTETTVFKFKASDWDALTHSVYVRYQPKEQRGLGISFSIDSPFKIASLSVGSKADAILVDKVSKGAVITPSNNDEW